MVLVDISAEPRAGGIESDSGGTGGVPGTKWCVVSYSLTGNNAALAESLARTFNADHFRIVETRRRTMGTIVFDMIFNRTPKVELGAEQIGQYDLVLFVGPVWMGKVATPFRACFEEMRARLKRYAYVSICGGADGHNPGLEDELRQRLGQDAVSVVELHIADLLPPDPTPRRKDTMAYAVGTDEIRRLTDAVVEAIPRHSSQRSRV